MSHHIAYTQLFGCVRMCVCVCVAYSNYGYCLWKSKLYSFVRLQSISFLIRVHFVALRVWYANTKTKNEIYTVRKSQPTPNTAIAQSQCKRASKWIFQNFITSMRSWWCRISFDCRHALATVQLIYDVKLQNSLPKRMFKNVNVFVPCGILVAMKVLSSAQYNSVQL